MIHSGIRLPSTAPSQTTGSFIRKPTGIITTTFRLTARLSTHRNHVLCRPADTALQIRIKISTLGRMQIVQVQRDTAHETWKKGFGKRAFDDASLAGAFIVVVFVAFFFDGSRGPEKVVLYVADLVACTLKITSFLGIV